MIVYASQLHVRGAEEVDRNCALESALNWIAGKARLQTEQLGGGGNWEHEDGSGVRVARWHTSPEQYPRLDAVQFSHWDSEVRGRKWVLEAGFRRGEAHENVLVTVLLRTEETDTRSGTAPAVASRPRLVDAVCSACELVHPTVGIDPVTMSEADVELYRDHLFDLERRCPVVLLSPDVFSGHPIIDPSELSRKLVGLAEVWVIGVNDLTFGVTQAVGRRLSAWAGAVNVIWPRSKISPTFMPNRVFRPQGPDDFYDGGRELLQDIFECVVSITNPAYARSHVSPGTVIREQHEQRVRKAIAAADESAILPELLAETLTEVERLKDQVAELQGEVDAEREQRRQSDYTIGVLRGQLERRRATQAETRLPVERDIESLDELIGIVRTEMVGRLVLTGRAERAMRSSPFADLETIYDAFRLLHDGLYEMFAGQVEMAEVDRMLQESAVEYAPSMSEITMGQFQDYEVRYKGRVADLSRHLKIGSSKDPRRCYRIHFEWDEDDRQIVIHHAGRHLQLYR